MPMVKWPDGSELRAETWDEMLDVLAREQWTPMRAAELRREMARRAQRWSNTRIETGGTPEDFFRELERAGMLNVAHPLPERI